MAKVIPKATHSGILKIGEKEIQCYVLEDGRRVISQRGFQKSIGMSSSGGTGGAHRMARFVTKLEEKGIKIKDLSERINNPIDFQPMRGAPAAYGYEAINLPEMCEFILQCRDALKLTAAQKHIAAECDIVMRAFARIGIIALVDEATGFQYDRDRNELNKILEAYIAKELLPWSKRFPDEFYKELFRLRGWQFSPFSVKRPQFVGKLTNQLIYEKLPPGVLDVLRTKNPKNEKGRRKHKYFQFLTDSIGNPHLEKQLVAVTTLMKVASNWRIFEGLFNRAFPTKQPKPEQSKMEFMEEQDE